ncbi:MAG: hypothetical protein JXK16_05970 [Thiotrichales bacterium]|nr:hypothetical protein [Thiotrichales bacterium]
MSKAITLWIPDFLNKQRIIESEQAWLDLSLPALRTLLKKADLFPVHSKNNQPVDDFYATASNLFHQNQTLPVAATMAKHFLEAFDDGLFWMKIDPVQMVPDRDTLVLIPGADLQISEQEALALIDAFNQHFQQDKVVIEYGSPTDWFLNIKQVVDIKTTSLNEASYQQLHEKYPTGHAAQYWRQLLNEASMLFYTHPVNEKRREAGLPEINGVWLWGEGRLKDVNLYPRATANIASENSYLAGMAKLTRAQSSAFPESLQACLDSDQTHHLLMPEFINLSLDKLTQEAWIESVNWLESDWMAPILTALKQKKIHSLLLELGDGHRYHIEPKHLNRFWRFKNRI